MEVCYICSNINFEQDVYALTLISTLKGKAEQGCPGCKFFLDVLGDSERASDHLDAAVYLQRASDEDNRVLLLIMNKNDELDRIVIRLCTPHGMQKTLYGSHGTDVLRV